MSVELDELAKSLYNGHIPSIWRALAPATRKLLGSWMVHFLRRNAQYSEWVRPVCVCCVCVLCLCVVCVVCCVCCMCCVCVVCVLCVCVCACVCV